MSYESVDALQLTLAKDVFHYAKDAKKAAGRALGTLVEIITFYLLKSWGCEKHMAIERRLPEYGNPDITHNVEFSLHPSQNVAPVKLFKTDLPITAAKIKRLIPNVEWLPAGLKTKQLLSSTKVVRNACTIYEDESMIIVAYLGSAGRSSYDVYVSQLTPHPFAVIECKRVGVEDGNKKGPQTIEKAKQGAYVARSVSSLQKIRMADGSLYGVLNLDSGELRCEPYSEFLEAVVASNEATLLRDFTLTIGVVSNHGNWFTSEDHNKELKVLAQSYDWLLFLTDSGLSTFVHSLLVNPAQSHRPVKDAFVQSYAGRRGENKFTKVQVALEADLALQEFFTSNLNLVESWLNVISPSNRTISELKKELALLSSKDWKEILQ